MSLDHRLIELLLCPLCKGPLHLARNPQGLPEELQCPVDRLGYPIRDGIPVMLESEARSLPPADSAPAVPPLGVPPTPAPAA